MCSTLAKESHHLLYDERLPIFKQVILTVLKTRLQRVTSFRFTNLCSVLTKLISVITTRCYVLGNKILQYTTFCVAQMATQNATFFWVLDLSRIIGILPIIRPKKPKILGQILKFLTYFYRKPLTLTAPYLTCMYSICISSICIR